MPAVSQPKFAQYCNMLEPSLYEMHYGRLQWTAPFHCCICNLSRHQGRLHRKIMFEAAVSWCTEKSGIGKDSRA